MFRIAINGQMWNVLSKILLNWKLIVSFQVKSIHDSLLFWGVDKRLLYPQHMTRFSSDSFLYPGMVDSFDLPSRISSSSLIKQYAMKIAEAQSEYKEKLKNIDLFLRGNLGLCLEIDEILQDHGQERETWPEISDDSEKDQIAVLKDGTRRLQCPLLKCKKRVFRLKRHLENIHENLTADQRQSAIRIARIIEDKKKKRLEMQNPGKKISDLYSRPSKKRIRNSGMSLVARKHNPKKCSMCSLLCINISQHLAKTHHLDRKDPCFKAHLRNSVVIPRCYTKEVKGRKVALEGKELQEAVEIYSSKIEAQLQFLKN